jgi:hypothetical protein
MDTQRSVATHEDVKLVILRQHTQLAELLDELESSADVVLVKGGNGEALRGALDALESRFVKHLEYEEANHPTFATNHVEHRARMKGLVHDRDVFGDPRGLAREARAFVHLLRKDLADEDRRLHDLG